MIESPSEALRARRGETFAVICLLAWAFVLPGAGWLVAERCEAHAEAWLVSYRPVIYLAEGLEAERGEALRAELERWPGVAHAVTRERAASLTALQQALGEERVAHLGISEAMLPRSVELVPSVPFHGHIELASRVASLSARPQVAAVDVPDAEALRLMEIARDGALAALLAMAVMLWCALWLAQAFLRRVQRDERELLELLEIFGASRAALVRPTLWRALIVSGWSSVAASAVLVVVQLHVERAFEALFGLSAGATSTWAVVILPLLLAPLIALALCKATIGFKALERPGQTLPGTRSLLSFTPSRFAPPTARSSP